MTNSFMGMVIEGEIEHYARTSTEQWPIELLEPYLRPLLRDPEVYSFGWNQYTPSFNDGEPCVFSAYGVWVRPKGAEPKTEDSEDYYDDDPDYEFEVKDYAYGDRPASPEHHVELQKAIEGGHFDNALEKTFGDPAEITFRDGKIFVDYYECGY